jgi:hypothetical protein
VHDATHIRVQFSKSLPASRHVIRGSGVEDPLPALTDSLILELDEDLLFFELYVLHHRLLPL